MLSLGRVIVLTFPLLLSVGRMVVLTLPWLLSLDHVVGLSLAYGPSQSCSAKTACSCTRQHGQARHYQTKTEYSALQKMVFLA